jgi:hypothetical protein
VLPIAIADEAPDEVHVRVDEPREHGLAREVHDLGALGNRDPRADRGDPVPLDHDDRVSNRRSAGAVDQDAGTDRGDRLGLLRGEALPG